MKLLNIQVKIEKTKVQEIKGEAVSNNFKLILKYHLMLINLIDMRNTVIVTTLEKMRKRYFTLMSSKLKKNIKLIKLLDRFLVG